MISSDFDYFAGGGLLKPDGADGKQKNLYETAKEAGYNVVLTKAEAEKINASSGKTIIIDETLADSDAMSYDMDLENGEWALKDYVKKGIEVLNNDKGFFMMVEGGKIDWACHANDAASTISDTLALDEAIQEAVAFYLSLIHIYIFCRRSFSYCYPHTFSELFQSFVKGCTFVI